MQSGEGQIAAAARNYLSALHATKQALRERDQDPTPDRSAVVYRALQLEDVARQEFERFIQAEKTQLPEAGTASQVLNSILMTQKRRKINDGLTRPIGILEMEVLEILWQNGESSVQTVTSALGQGRAYTTLLATLSRLHAKGFVVRHIRGRAFLYSAAFSRAEWDRRRTRDFLANFGSREFLATCLVDAIAQYGEGTLASLEEKIRLKRSDLDVRKPPP
jgi:predicted transcriptional regulator